MKWRVASLLLFSAVLLGTTQCYYDDARTLYGTTSCDTAAVTWTADIQPLFQAQCGGCHGAISPGGGLSLINYSQISAASLNGSCMNRIQMPAGSPMAMPPNGSLTSCQKAKIRTWIRQGALQN